VALDVVLWVGVITAVFAASVGLVQTDIKRVLAYSHGEQHRLHVRRARARRLRGRHLPPGDPRLLQGAALLGAGSVIHGLHGEQDLRKMGGWGHGCA